MLAVLVVPILVAVYSSFFSVSMLNLSAMRFVGLENYQRMLGSDTFWQSLATTVGYTVGVVVLAYLIALSLALLLQGRFRGRGVARTIAIMPWAVPPVVAVLVWVWILDANFGVLNYALTRALGLPTGLNWLGNGQLAQVSVIIVSSWVLYPVALTMLMAGLQGIDTTLYEAAAVDGAGALGRFRHVTLPGLAPVNLVLVLLLVLMAFTRVVTIIFVMTGGGPGRSTETLPLQVYLEAFKYRQLGYASAVGIAVLLLAMVISLVYYRLASRLTPRTDR